MKLNEKGSVTMIVVVTIFFIVILLSSFLIYASSRRKAQLKATEKIAQAYDGDMNQIYEEKTQEKEDDAIKIPDGFYYAGGNKDTGLVISDSDKDKKEYNEENRNAPVSTDLQGNQFVWVPVTNPDELFVNETVKLYEVKTTTDVYSTLSKRDGEEYIIGKPGEANKVREPDGISLDQSASFADIILGTNGTGNAEELAKLFVQDYKEMSDSIKKYKGFYIGRYELTGTIENPTQKKGEPLGNENWYSLYKACKGFSKENATSTMIYGCQWDAVCRWLAKSGYNTDSDSSEWGNYGTGLQINTGFNTKYKANNIFDLAGNCLEYTQEAIFTNSRTARGGSYYDSARNAPASNRINGYPHFEEKSATSRPVLYMK